MSPIEQIEQGILQQDWGMVRDAYTAMTGRQVEALEEAEPAPQKKKRGRPKKNQPKAEPKRKGPSSGPVILKHSGWVDDGKHHLADADFDRKTLPTTATPRRSTNSLMPVTCSGCKQEFHVPEKIVMRPGESLKESIRKFRCNNCDGPGAEDD